MFADEGDFFQSNRTNNLYIRSTVLMGKKLARYLFIAIIFFALMIFSLTCFSENHFVSRMRPM